MTERYKDHGKTFDDAAGYAADIRNVVPGYDLVRELALATLQRALPGEGELLVVGSGPGAEVVQAAQALPTWRVEVVEPSPEMFAETLAVVEDAGLGQRVRVDNRPLTRAPKPIADAALCLLVAHLIPDDGARATFWDALGSSLRPGGLLVLAEIEAMNSEELEDWRLWSKARGCSTARLDTLTERLSSGFSMLTPEQTASYARRAGFVHDGLILRALGLTLTRWRQR